MSNGSPSILRAWMTVALLWFVGCLNYIDRVMITTMRGSLVEAIPMTDAQFGLLTTVFLLVYAVLSPFAGFLADRFNRSRVIVVSLVVWSAVTWMTAHAATYGQLLLTRALMGISEACYIPAALALIADYHGPKTRSLANGTHLSGVMIGAGLGGLGGWIAERHGWAQAFVWFGQLGIVLAIVAVCYLRDWRPETPVGEAEALAPPPRMHLGEAVRSLFSRREFSLSLGFWGLMALSVWAVVGWMPTYLNEHFHLSQGVAGLSATGYYQGASLVGVILGGFLADRWSSRHAHAPVLVPLLGTLVAAPAIMIAASTDNLPLAIGALAAFGLTKSFTDANMMPILTLISDRRFRATGYGILNFCACVVGGITIYAGGLLRDAKIDVSRVFQFGAGCIVVSAVLMYLILPRGKKS